MKDRINYDSAIRKLYLQRCEAVLKQILIKKHSKHTPNSSLSKRVEKAGAF
jgi:hypothetical protein